MLKTYDVVITDDMLIKGVKAISLVENPALHSTFIALSEIQEIIELAEVDKEKHILLGAVLIPDKPILRHGTPEDFYIKFSTDTIEKAQEMFFKSGFQNFSTIEHNKKPIDGNTIIESWIVEDTDKDKTAFYNLSVPKGSWVVKMKIGNKDVWDNYVKTNKVKGFSIEGFFKPVDVTEMSSEKLTINEKILRIREILNQ